MISVVIPVYNAAATLKRCVDSCLSQSFHDLEIVCVNDGSTDGSEDVLLSYGDKIRVVSQGNAGVVSARHKGVEVARGEWVYFLDSDDYLPPSALADLAAIIDERTDVAFGNQIVVLNDRLEERVLLPVGLMTGLEYADYSLAHGQGTIGGKMFRRSLCERLEIDSHLQLNEDLLMNIQIGLMAREVRYCGKSNYYYWWGSVDSLSKQVNARSVGSVMAVNRRIKEMLAENLNARHILDLGYLPYTLRNAAQLYALDFDVPEMSFVLKEARRIAIRHPLRFLQEAVKRKSCILPFVMQLFGLSLGRRCYHLVLRLRGCIHGV